MSRPGASPQGLRRDVDALVAAVLVGAPLRQTTPIADRITAAVDHLDAIPTGAISALRSAIDLLTRRGNSCATTSALLIARSQLATPLRAPRVSTTARAVRR